MEKQDMLVPTVSMLQHKQEILEDIEKENIILNFIFMQ